MAASSFRELEVWNLAMDFSGHVYRAVRAFPRDETYGMVSQLRRAVVSVAANIAEGNARAHAGDYLRHLSFARGSVAEVETLLELSARLEYLGPQESKPRSILPNALGRC